MEFNKHFSIESRNEITLNVKHAGKLQRKRKAEILRKRVISRVKESWLEQFEALIEQVQIKEEQADQTKYYVYVLTHKH